MAKVDKSPKVDTIKSLDINKDGYSNGGITVEPASQNLELDPRSEILTNQDRVYNKIGVGEEVEVRGTRRMLKSKSKKATWY